MDILTRRIIELIKVESSNGQFPVNVTEFTFEGIEDWPMNYLSWSTTPLMASVPVDSLLFRYHECGDVSVISLPKIVLLRNSSEGKWSLSGIRLKGSDIDRDVEIVIKSDQYFESEKEYFCTYAFMSEWPHLRDYVKLCLTICLLIQQAVFEGVKADALSSERLCA